MAMCGKYGRPTDRAAYYAEQCEEEEEEEEEEERRLEELQGDLIGCRTAAQEPERN